MLLPLCCWQHLVYLNGTGLCSNCIALRRDKQRPLDDMHAVTLCRTESHSDQIALGGLEKKTIFQGIDKGHFSSALPETMDAVLSHISCVRLLADA